ncbi:MAG TPA: YigZ family protein [Longimicrobiaceae bacterium]|nr:YigZ family protein [Longimicrobiaceae bacterium]
MDAPYRTLAGRGAAETRVRASRFIAVAGPARDEAQARDLLDAEQRRWFDATHHCSAWRLHDGAWRANDAGEPAGSAGAPILAAIDAAGLEDCVVVVTRYFGGTKLGVGGLARAYAEAAALALEAAPRRAAIPALELRVRYPYDQTAAVMRLMERYALGRPEHGYTAGGASGEVRFAVARDAVAALTGALRDRTAGAAKLETLGQCVLYHPAGPAA